jgi:hypothetical protein
VALQFEAFQQRNAQVVAVSFTPPGRVAAFLTANPLPFPAFSDPERKAYRTFSLGRTSWATMLHPRVLWGYLKLIWRGTRPEKPEAGEDLFQLGGDFVLDEAGRLVFAYPSKTSTDRPPVAMLLDAVRKATEQDGSPMEDDHQGPDSSVPLSDLCP